MSDDGEPILRYELQRPCKRTHIRAVDLFESAGEPIDEAAFAQK